MPRPKKEQPNHAGELYEVKITTGKTFDGKLIRKSFYSNISKADAKAKADEYKINQAVAEQTGTVFVSKDVTFQEWAIKWLETYKKGNCKEHTYNYTYRVNIEKYMIPFFKKAILSDVRQADIQKYFNEHSFLAETNLKRHKNILHSIFEQAIYNDLCIKNPVINIKYVSDKAKWEKKAYNLLQSKAAEKYARNDKQGLGAYIILNTGVRRGELLGLKWEDIDFKRNIVSVKRAIEPDTQGMPLDGEVKTNSALRDIPVSKEFINYLKTIEQKSLFILAGKTQWGYTSIDGYDKQHKKFMEKMSSELNIPYLSPHELRHTFGTVLREKGVDLYTISRVMGHSDSSVTEKIYVHNDVNVLKKRMLIKN